MKAWEEVARKALAANKVLEDHSARKVLAAKNLMELVGGYKEAFAILDAVMTVEAKERESE